MIRIVEHALQPRNQGQSSRLRQAFVAADSSRLGQVRRGRLDLIEHAAVARDRLEAQSTHLWRARLTAGQPTIVLLTADQAGLELAIWLPDGRLRDANAAGRVEQILVIRPSHSGQSTICIHNRSDASISYELLLP
jgi:hypothetical protein